MNYISVSPFLATYLVVKLDLKWNPSSSIEYHSCLFSRWFLRADLSELIYSIVYLIVVFSFRSYSCAKSFWTLFEFLSYDNPEYVSRKRYFYVSIFSSVNEPTAKNISLRTEYIYRSAIP